MNAVITPDNVQLALFGIAAGPFILLVIVELITGRSLSTSGFFRFDRREEEPFDYWFNVALHLGVIGFFAWMCFFGLG